MHGTCFLISTQRTRYISFILCLLLLFQHCMLSLIDSDHLSNIETSVSVLETVQISFLNILVYTDDNSISPGGGGPGLWLLGGPGVPGVAHHDVVPDLVIK